MGNKRDRSRDPLTSAAALELVSVVLPVRDEPENIAACFERLAGALSATPHEVLVCFDSPEDTTLPVIERAPIKPSRLVLVKNELGPGPSFAMRAGLQRASGDVVVTSMADLSDPPEIILSMAAKIRREHADVVSGSRYMAGGKQVGGPRLKTLLSRVAGVSLYWIAGIRTHDATTNFRAYSRHLLQAVKPESGRAFSLGLELTVKAHLLGFRVDEVPSTWIERHAGESRFRLGPWLPEYLRFYLRAVAAPLIALAALLSGGLLLLYGSESALLGALRIGVAVIVLVIARRLRGRTTMLDAALPFVVCLPIAALGLKGWLVRGALLCALLAFAAQRHLPRRER